MAPLLELRTDSLRFRWVSCQLDYLCELPTDTDRKEALGKLPPTLNETYARILRNTPQASKRILQLTLRLLASAGTQITIPQLCNVLSLRDGKSCIDEDDNLYEDDIKGICSSLIRKSSNRKHFEFAHYTVREFLESSSLGTDPELEVYCITPEDGWVLTRLCLRFLMLDNFSKPLPAHAEVLNTINSMDSRHPFYHFATWKWPFLFRSILAQSRTPLTRDQGSAFRFSTCQIEPTLDDVYKLFGSPKRPHFVLWSVNFVVMFRRCYEQDIEPLNIIPHIVHADFTPLHMASILTLDCLLTKLAGQDTKALTSSKGIASPVQCLVLGLPALLSDIPNNLVCDRLSYGLQYALYHEWMGPSTSFNIWVDALMALSRTCAIESEEVKLGSMQYSVLDLVCRRASNEEFVTFTEAFTYFFRNGAKLSDTSMPSIRDKFSDFRKWSSTSREAFSLAGFLNAVDQTGDKGLQDRPTMSHILQVLAKIDAFMCNTLADTERMKEYVELDDQGYELAVKVSVQFDDISKLLQLSSDSRFSVLAEEGSNGQSLLHVAAREDSLEVLQFLLNFGLDASGQDTDGQTPLHVSRPKCVPLLLHHGVSDAARDFHGNTVWHSAACSVYTTLDTLLNAGLAVETRLKEVNDKGYTPMALALSPGSISKKWNVDRLLPHCRTAEYFAGPLHLYQAALEADYPEVIEALIDRGIVVDEFTSPLHRVTPYTDGKIIRLLKSLRRDPCSYRHENRLPIESQEALCA